MSHDGMMNCVVFILVQRDLHMRELLMHRCSGRDGPDIWIENLKNSNNLKMEVLCFCISFGLILEKCKIARNEQMGKI